MTGPDTATGTALPSLLVPDGNGRLADLSESMLRVIPHMVPETLRGLRRDPASTVAVDAFMERLGGEAGIPAWLDLTRLKHSLADDAEIEGLRLAKVRAARFVPWSPDADACDPYAERFGTVRELAGSMDPDDHRLDAAAWVVSPCPYVWATKDLAWPGADAADLREDALARSADVTDAALAEAMAQDVDIGLSDWWGEDTEDTEAGASDEARTPRIDLDGLTAILVAWLPHAGSGDSVDTGFEARIMAWNSAQGVSASWPDEETVLGTTATVTHGDCVAWHEARLAAVSAAREALAMPGSTA